MASILLFVFCCASGTSRKHVRRVLSTCRLGQRSWGRCSRPGPRGAGQTTRAVGRRPGAAT
eukprot:8450741-Alexandrium_andersonii.AAC.1